jgi:hypothetical protein
LPNYLLDGGIGELRDEWHALIPAKLIDNLCHALREPKTLGGFAYE